MAGAKILIVDDHPDRLYFLGKVLRDAGYSVIESQTATRGITMAFNEQPNLIIIDLVMPETTGWEVARRLKVDSRTAKIPLFLVTGSSSRVSEQWAFDGDCDALLVKPVEPARLLAEVERWL